jgi:hypothetical protein
MEGRGSPGDFSRISAMRTSINWRNFGFSLELSRKGVLCNTITIVLAISRGMSRQRREMMVLGVSPTINAAMEHREEEHGRTRKGTAGLGCPDSPIELREDEHGRTRKGMAGLGWPDSPFQR